MVRSGFRYGFMYGFVSALHSKLLSYAEYEGLIEAMSLEDVVSSLSDYPELRDRVGDIRELEKGLYEHLSRVYTDVLSTFSEGEELEKVILGEWDLKNFKRIVRGIQRGLPSDDIKELIIPIGTLPINYFEYLAESEGVEDFLSRLPQDYSNVKVLLEKGLPPDLALESQLVEKWKSLDYYFIKVHIDVLNIEIIYRCQIAYIDPSEFIMEGGYFIDQERIRAMVTAEDERAMLSNLAGTPFEGAEEEKNLERFLYHVELRLLKEKALSNPLSIDSAVYYLKAKEVEVFNIRAIMISKIQEVPVREVLVYV